MGQNDARIVQNGQRNGLELGTHPTTPQKHMQQHETTERRMDNRSPENPRNSQQLLEGGHVPHKEDPNMGRFPQHTGTTSKAGNGQQGPPQKANGSHNAERSEKTQQEEQTDGEQRTLKPSQKKSSNNCLNSSHGSKKKEQYPRSGKH